MADASTTDFRTHAAIDAPAIHPATEHGAPTHRDPGRDQLARRFSPRNLARVGRRLLLATAPLLLVLEVPGAFELLQRPDLGFQLKLTTLMEVEPGGAAARGGLRVGDELVRVDGERVHGHADLLAALTQHRDAQSLEVEVERGRARVITTLPLTGRAAEARVLDLLMSFSALCFLFLGFATYLRRDDALGRTFFLTCLLLAFPFLDLPSFPDPWVMRALQGIRDAAQVLMPAFLLRFVFLFPEGPAASGRRRRIELAVLAPALLLAPLHMASALMVHEPQVRSLEHALLLASVLLFATYIVTTLAVFARKIHRLDRFEMRTKLRLALLGLVAGVGPLTLMAVVRHFHPAYTGPWADLAVLALPLVPASFSVALLRTGAVDLAYLIRQVLIAVFLALPIVIVAWLLAGVTEPYLPPRWRALLYVGVLVAVPMVSVLVRAPSRTISVWIDRVLYPEQQRVRESSNQLGQRLSEILAPDDVLEELVQGASESMGAAHASVHELSQHTWMQTVPSRNATLGLSARSALAAQIEQSRELIALDPRARGPRSLLDRESWAWIELCDVHVVAPLNAGGETLGLLALGPRLRGGGYGAVHLYHLGVLCRQAAAALQNARLHEEDLARERVRTELDLARQIQEQLLPQAPLRSANLELCGRTESCRAVGGDLFDYFELSDGRVVAVVADAAGKGIPASLLTSGLRTAVRETMRPGLPVEEAVAHVNRHVHGMTAQGNFIAMFVATIEPTSGLLEYCVAGIEPPVWIRRDLGRAELLTQGGAVLGIDPQARYRSGTLRLGAGDSLLIYTDGAIDEEDAQGEEFGRDRLRETALAHRDAGAEGILTALLERLHAHRSGEAIDDTTLMVVRRSRSARDGMDDASALG